jgi:hypothetical protein
MRQAHDVLAQWTVAALLSETLSESEQVTTVGHGGRHREVSS